MPRAGEGVKAPDGVGRVRWTGRMDYDGRAALMRE